MSIFDAYHDKRIILGADWVEDRILEASIVGFEQNSVLIEIVIPSDPACARVVRIDLFPRR